MNRGRKSSIILITMLIGAEFMLLPTTMAAEPARPMLPDMVTLPAASPAAAPPTTPTRTPTRTPTVTPSPTITPAPEGTHLRLLATADTFLSQSFPNVNFGQDAYLRTQNRTPDRRYETLIRFDDLPLGPDDQVVAAKLAMSVEWSTGEPVEAALILEPWLELGTNWNVAPASESFATQPETVPPPDAWLHLDITEAVAAWIRGDRENHGLRIHQPEVSSDDGSRFHSRESAFQDRRPELHIAYLAASTPSPTPRPEPSRTPAPVDVRVEISANRDVYSSGDHLEWGLEATNLRNLVMQIRVYAVLETYGEFYFYPAWTTDPEGFALGLAPFDSHQRRLLELDLPDPLPAGGPFFLWAGAVHRGTGALSSNIASDSFAFVPLVGS